MVLSNDMKKAIAFGLIIGAILSICNMCFAADEVEVLTLPNRTFNSARTQIVYNDSLSLYYIPIESGFSYSITNISSAAPRYIAFFNNTDVGSPILSGFNLAAGNSYTFNGGTTKYLIVGSSASNNPLSITREELVGMTGFVDNLAYDLSYANLNGVVTFVIPIMAISILFALGFYLLKRLLNRIKKVKGGV